MTLISQLIEVPESVDKSAFVLELSSGVTQVQRTLDSYVVTDEPCARFDEALGLIKPTVQTGASKAVLPARAGPPRRARGGRPDWRDAVAPGPREARRIAAGAQRVG